MEKILRLFLKRVACFLSNEYELFFLREMEKFDAFTTNFEEEKNAQLSQC